MTSIKTTLSVALTAAGLTAGMLVASSGAMVNAQPAPPPAPVQGEVPPAWAPPKPGEFWNGAPIVWYSGWGGRWGVWLNGAFMPLTSNPVTNGG